MSATWALAVTKEFPPRSDCFTSVFALTKLPDNLSLLRAVLWGVFLGPAGVAHLGKWSCASWSDNISLKPISDLSLSRNLNITQICCSYLHYFYWTRGGASSGLGRPDLQDVDTTTGAGKVDGSSTAGNVLLDHARLLGAC